MWLNIIWFQLYIAFLELSKKVCSADLANSLKDNCCNGILGYPGPFEFMPCSEMKCCEESETVALQKVNHALGFCFRCVPEDHNMSKCYSLGQEVATTNDTRMYYELRTCCRGLKFKVFTYTDDVALVIKCVTR